MAVATPNDTAVATVDRAAGTRLTTGINPDETTDGIASLGYDRTIDAELRKDSREVVATGPRAFEWTRFPLSVSAQLLMRAIRAEES